MTITTQQSNARESRIRQFRDLWNVPRMFVVEEEGRTLLFDCPFDEETEDFARDYRVYEMPSLTDADLSESWAGLPRRAVRQLGTVPVKQVAFGADARLSLSRASIEPFLTQLHAGVTVAPALWVGGGLEWAGVIGVVLLVLGGLWFRGINLILFGSLLVLALLVILWGRFVLRRFHASHAVRPLPVVFKFAFRLSEQPSFAVLGVAALPVIVVILFKVYLMMHPVVVIQDG